MATFVLVHGGWHGGWCWQRVAPLLRAAGHAVWAPTLTGLADRAHALTRDTGLATHVADVARLLAFEELTGVVLVGHSYGGMVTTGVAAAAPDRLAALVYLDAMVPADGQSVFDLLPPARGAFLREQANARGDGWRVPPPSPAALGIDDGTEARWLAGKLTDHPLRAFQEPSAQPGPAPDLPRTYVHCTDGPIVPSFAPFAARFRHDPGWAYHELATGHDAMLSEPRAVADRLLAAAT